MEALVQLTWNDPDRKHRNIKDNTYRRSKGGSKGDNQRKQKKKIKKMRESLGRNKQFK